MFNRYAQFAIPLVDANGNEFLSGLPFVDYQYTGEIKYHQIQENEIGALDLISYIWFNDGSYWPLIAWFNNIQDEFTDMVIGETLMIPVDGPSLISAIVPFTYQQ